MAEKKSQALRRAEIPSVATRRSTMPGALDDLSATQPEDVIDRLGGINLDLSRAIVQLAETRAPRRALPAPVEISEYGHGALIGVSPVAALRRLRGRRSAAPARRRAAAS